MMKKRLGFTLSEVLVAMVIIGVISSLMVPRLLGNATKKQFTTQFKTTLSLINSAAKEFKVEEGGYDFSGNRVHSRGDRNISDILRDKFDAQLIQSGEYTVLGRTYVAKGGSHVEGEPIAVNLVTTAVSAGDYTKPDTALSIPFGSIEETTNNCWNIAIGQEQEQSAQEKGGTKGKTSSFSNTVDCTTWPKSFTVKLNNGAYIFIPLNDEGCNYHNVRWDSKNHTYITPNPLDAGNEHTNLCMAFIDVNGPKGPNRIATCAGTNMLVFPGSTETCNMSINNVTDVYPVFFYDDSVYPATNATNTVWLDRVSE
ncbi:type II secretion system protein [bacterium]|nr:type II secretion system protein [bacterium]